MLFEPLTIRDIRFRNRIVMSPMCQYSAINGYANDWHLVHYGSRAVGGAGLVIMEATAVSPEGRITPGDLGIYDDDHIVQLRKINAFLHQYGAISGIQLAHAGRKAGCALPVEGGKQLGINKGGWQTLAPSPVPFYADDSFPLMLDTAGIKAIIASFRKGAQRSLEAGFKVVEIHAAHGYLIHQFLSPLSNKRTDEYGGDFNNRIRFLKEIVTAVREVWPENLPLFVRISATDYSEGGWNVDESTQLAVILKTMGVDLIDTSSGGLVYDAKIPFGPGYQVMFSEKLRKETGIKTAAVGLITEPSQAEEILLKGQADMIMLGRELLRNPYFPLFAANTLSNEIEWPLQYKRAQK
ncbi:MAG: NADPH dehydrogenase NamA [Bacteroidales bacterium]|nr:NADPH dehydrogenase NamA [Bacteroidales bacterium]